MLYDHRFDWHVHIGQFDKEYFYPHKVIQALYAAGLTGCAVSSLTSCIGWQDRETRDMVVNHIRDEIAEAVETGNTLGFRVVPLYWVIPARHEEGEELEDIMSESQYKGFKLHTRVTDWRHGFNKELLEKVFSYADDRGLPVMIHTGYDPMEIPDNFENQFIRYPNVSFILAHAKPLENCLGMLQKYPNVFVDTAFVPYESISLIEKEGLGDRILNGSDYPVGNLRYCSTVHEAVQRYSDVY